MATIPAVFELDLNMASAPDPCVERLAHAPIRKQAQGKCTRPQGIVAQFVLVQQALGPESRRRCWPSSTRANRALGLPLRSVECEYGPSQCEFTFQALRGLEPADTMVLFRSAVKQICRRHGLHATFMCRPLIPNVMSSGWHLHQSLIDRKTGANALDRKSVV